MESVVAFDMLEEGTKCGQAGEYPKVNWIVAWSSVLLLPTQRRSD